MALSDSASRQLAQFSNVDEAGNPDEFVRFLDLAAKEAAEKKQATYRWMGVKPGDRVLDVGCGPGMDVQALAGLVGADGLAVGVDKSETMVAEARDRAAAVKTPIDFRQEDAHHLSLGTDTFDSCRCERFLEHVEEPSQVIGEMARVVRPGGRVVAMEPDWGTVAMDTPDRKLTSQVIDLIAKDIANDWVGRQLPRLFSKHGLLEIQVIADVWTVTNFRLASHLLKLDATLAEAVEEGVLSDSNATIWLKCAADADRAGEFFAALTFFTAVGTKPRPE